MTSDSFPIERRNIGWRTTSPSNARVWHELDEDGNPICGATNIAVTNGVLLDAPRAFPPKRVAKLRALPKCAGCIRHENSPRGRLETLERENAQLRQRIAELEQQLQNA